MRAFHTLYRGLQTFSLELNLFSVDSLLNRHDFFQMSWSIMEEFAPTEEEDQILDRWKLLVQESLPESEKNWKTLDLSMENLFGLELQVNS